MIKAKLRKNCDRYYFDVNGHAEKDGEGDEKICSAASVLFCALESNLADLEDKKMITDLYSNVAPGSAHIEFELAEKPFYDGDVPVTDAEAAGISESEIVLFAFLRGFELLGEKYPEYVSTDVKTFY